VNDDRRLIEQARTDPEAFRTVYRAYFPRVYAYIVYRVGRETDAEDLTADVFIRVAKAIGRFEPRNDHGFVAWVFTIARNVLAQFYRDQPSQPILSLDELPHIEGVAASPEEIYADKERFRRLHVLVKTLSPRRQEIIILRYFGGLKNREIAEVLELDERTVASHLSRALDDLHRIYTDELGAEYVHEQ
jgi:RNA polymerase sigma-70 factor, ECF subfamily